MFNLFFYQEPKYEDTFKKLKESNENNILENIGCIKKFICEKNISNIEELKDQIILFTSIYNHNKSIISALKSLSIYINKTYCNNTILLKKINYLVKISNNPSLYKPNEYQKKKQHIINKIILQIDESKTQCVTTIETLESFITDDINNKILKAYPQLLILINICKSRFPTMFINSSLERILYKIDSHIYDYIYFLSSSSIINTKESSIKLLTNFNFKSIDNEIIDSIGLKRGFIQTFLKNQKQYLLKYQPNRSIMEIVLNVYLKSIFYDESINYFLFPDYLFINDDRSYCYVIEKYDIDLYKYFSILHENNIILSLTDILQITSFMTNAIQFLFKNNIIHSDLKLENIVLNYKIDILNKKSKITHLKIIDFDVSIFNTIPDNLQPIPEEFQKTFHNKKIRGTKIYMLKDKLMSFKNDIYSLGMVILIMLFKNIKLIISIKKNALDPNNPFNKKTSIKYNTFLKKLNTLRNEIEIDDNKFKIIDLICEIVETNNINFFTIINDKMKFALLIEFIKDCINIGVKYYYNVEELYEKYQSIMIDFHYC